MIQIVKLGSQGLEVSRQGLGCMGMSEFYGEADESESVATIHRALELGVTLLDTSDIYGPFTNERLVGRAIADRRGDVMLATKFGIVRDEDGGRRGIDGSADYVRRACEASLQRLGIDHIDLYYQHRVDPGTPIEETVGAMAELVERGQGALPRPVRGGAGHDPARARGPPDQRAADRVLAVGARRRRPRSCRRCRELGIGFVPYSPLGRGFLTGRYKSLEGLAADDFRRSVPRFGDRHLDDNLRIVEAVEAVAAEKDATAAQVALAWVHAQGEDIVPIPGTTTRRHLESNVAALDVALSAADLERLSELGTATGDRYADMGGVNR